MPFIFIDVGTQYSVTTLGLCIFLIMKGFGKQSATQSGRGHLLFIFISFGKIAMCNLHFLKSLHILNAVLLQNRCINSTIMKL